MNMNLCRHAKLHMEKVADLMLVGVMGLALWAGHAYGADATVTWTHPTQRVDSTPLALTEIRETQVDWARCAAGNVFPATVDGTRAVAAPATTTTITALAYGTWCFRARTVDTGGHASDNSAVVWRQYLAPPRPPVITTVAGLVWELRMHPADGPYLARVIGTIEAGKPCLGLAPQIGFDLFAVNPADATLTRKPNPNATVVAQCSIAEA